jgi:serine/threonine protein kinase
MNIGDIVGQYTILDKIGEGGMGCVLKVIDNTTRKNFALKYCKDRDEKSIGRFKREVKIISTCKHQNIVEVIDVNLEHIPPYFTMPLAKGSVSDVLKHITGDFDKVLRVFEPICKGVTALHNLGMYHRDIKPSNALIFENGIIAIADFGLAKMEIRDSSTHTSSNDFLGTYGYNAPEQFEAKNSDARTDVFQLGRTFYEMYTGDYPYLINPKKIPTGLVYIIQKSTEPDQDDRYQTVSDLFQAIKSYEKSLNPKENPNDALSNKLNEINKLLQGGVYKEELCTELIDLLGNNKNDNKLFIEYFDQIPNQILKILSNQLHSRFEPLLKEYTEQLPKYLSENRLDFSYAETVASKMSSIFRSTENVFSKGLAIKNILRAAVMFNRFNAMDTFNKLLQEIKVDEVAGIVAQILEEEIELYSQIADQAADNLLHPIIFETKTKANAYLKAETDKRNKEIEDFFKELLN